MMASIDGVCEECGNTGLVGEICSFCGSRIEPIDKGIERFEEAEVVPVVRKSKASINPRSGDMFDEEEDDLEDIDLDDDLKDLDELEDDDGGSDNVSMDDLAEKENDKEDKKAWFDPDNFNIDEDPAEEKGK